VLFGAYNPSAKLPVTIPRSVGQIPIHYNHKNTGRPGVEGCLTTAGTWIFPPRRSTVGYGLSYTTFSYSDLVIGEEKGGRADTVELRMERHAEGVHRGEEYGGT